MTEERYVSLAELAVYSTLSRRQLRRLTDAAIHPLPAHRVGARLLFKLSEFDTWVREQAGRRPAVRPLPPKLALAVRGRRC
jgi:excisionase family DNA binding protein